MAAPRIAIHYQTTLNTPTHIPRFDCFDVPKALTPVTAAREQILGGLPDRARTETIALANADGRILAQAVRATADVPPHANSAMDGFAIRAVDLAGDSPVSFTVLGLSLAGKPAQVTVDAGQCVQIMTGAAIPDGADTVVPQEATVVDDSGQVRIDVDHRKGQNVRAAGEDIRAGDVVLEAGTRIGAAELGVLASMGCAEVVVFRVLRVAVFSTGDELREPGDTLSAGQIHDCNRPILRSLVARLGCEVSDLGILADDQDTVRAALEQAAHNHDVIITSGGVSTGVADYVTRTLEELGQLGVWRIALRPGRPFAHGRIKECEFFGLPGNPVAVMVTFDQLVTPALRLLSGEQQVAAPWRFRVRLADSLRKKPNRTELYRAVLSRDDSGELSVASTGSQGSGLLTSMSVANCFIILDHDADGVQTGELVDVIAFDRL